jgi:UPF0042 nucleotide-binding protein
MKLFIVSGTSGAGKSIALNALEDLGFYCIDNLPLALLPAFAAEAAAGSRQQNYENAAVGIDARNLTDDLSSIAATLNQLRDTGIDTEVIFVDADDATLLKRFSETRRPHPLAGAEVPLEEAIHQERLLLKRRHDRRYQPHQCAPTARPYSEACRQGGRQGYVTAVRIVRLQARHSHRG